VAVWFDLDGTLLAVDDYGAVLERACEAVGVTGTTQTAFLAAYHETFTEQFDALAPEPYLDAARAGDAAVDRTVDPTAFVDALLHAECVESRVPAVVPETLAGLDRRVGVLTNGLRAWQTAKLAHHGLDEHVDTVVASETAGAHKPDPAPFELAARRLPATEQWLVGDDPEADAAGARAAGWRAVHVDGPASVPDAVAQL
jgi:haloacid dehalogenase superfamily, subfamily IA, variant 3 with third motif having DD or ED/haloacid dehalogenase superfamily, subfamily IA, variant 1 with third motif having Dx(3-4)D or Dx(3-4)E